MLTETAGDHMTSEQDGYDDEDYFASEAQDNIINE